MKLEQFIIQDGAGYEFTGEFRIPDASEDYWMDPDTVKIVHGDLATYCYRRLIYKLIAPKTVYYKKEGDAYKFTGRIGIATVDEYFLDDKGSMLRGMLFRQDKDYPVYTLLAQKHTEGTKFQKGNDDGAGRPQGEGSKLYFYTTDIPIDPSKPTSFKTMKGMSELQEKLKKEFSGPPPFIKQGEDYFLYVKNGSPDKGVYYYFGDKVILSKTGFFANIPIYEKLPLTLIQDDVQYVFTGEYRSVGLYEWFLNKGTLLKWCNFLAPKTTESHPIYITFEDYYWKKYPAMDAAGKKYVSFRTAPLLRQWADENMSGAAIQKLQEMNRRELSPTECLQLFDYWLLKNPVLDYGHIEYDKKPLFQHFKCEKENGAYTAQTISIMKAIVYNGAAYEKEKTICFPSGHIEGINHRYQKELSFEELKSLNVQFMSIGKFFSSVNDSQFIESAINYKILE